MLKKPLIIANWKSHKTRSEAQDWLTKVIEGDEGLECVIAPPATLYGVCSKLPKHWQLAAQDVSPFPLGAYTGALAASQLLDVGISYCIVGHSERRRYFHETNQDVVHKCEQLLSVGIRPVVCVDQPYAQTQLELLASAGIDSASIDIALEPLSAIGSQQPADPTTEQVEIEKLHADWPDSRVLYGGSVTAENVGEYLLISGGVLVATASLDVSSMNSLVTQALHSKIK